MCFSRCTRSVFVFCAAQYSNPIWSISNLAEFARQRPNRDQDQLDALGVIISGSVFNKHALLSDPHIISLMSQRGTTFCVVLQDLENGRTHDVCRLDNQNNKLLWITDSDDIGVMLYDSELAASASNQSSQFDSASFGAAAGSTPDHIGSPKDVLSLSSSTPSLAV